MKIHFKLKVLICCNHKRELWRSFRNIWSSGTIAQPPNVIGSRHSRNSQAYTRLIFLIKSLFWYFYDRSKDTLRSVMFSYSFLSSQWHYHAAYRAKHFARRNHMGKSYLTTLSFSKAFIKIYHLLTIFSLKKKRKKDYPYSIQICADVCCISESHRNFNELIIYTIK